MKEDKNRKEVTKDRNTEGKQLKEYARKKRKKIMKEGERNEMFGKKEAVKFETVYRLTISQ